jgi:hypothetical protein
MIKYIFVFVLFQLSSVAGVKDDSSSHETFYNKAVAFEMVSIMEVKNKKIQVKEVLCGSSKNFEAVTTRSPEGRQFLLLWSQNDVNFEIFTINKNCIRFGN